MCSDLSQLYLNECKCLMQNMNLIRFLLDSLDKESELVETKHRPGEFWTHHLISWSFFICIFYDCFIHYWHSLSFQLHDFPIVWKEFPYMLSTFFCLQSNNISVTFRSSDLGGQFIWRGTPSLSSLEVYFWLQLNSELPLIGDIWGW